MKTSALLCCILISTLFFSCKKENLNCDKHCLVNIVNDIEDNGQSSSETYQYDASGRVTSVVFTYGHQTITYTGNTFDMLDYNNSNTLIRHVWGNVNSDGAITLSIDSSSMGIDSFIATYDSNNRMTNAHQFEQGNSLDYIYYYNNDNVDSIAVLLSGTPYCTLLFEYFVDKENSIRFDPMYQLLGADRFSNLLGKTSQNLPKSFSYFGDSTNYTYTLNDDCSITSFRESIGSHFVDHQLTTNCQ